MKTTWLKDTKRLVLSELKDEDVRILLFGSRAREDAQRASDVDIGIFPKNGWNDKTRLVLMREKLENMNTPYKIDLVDLSEVDNEFYKNILEDAIVWRD